jgi:hypothetical protein
VFFLIGCLPPEGSAAEFLPTRGGRRRTSLQVKARFHLTRGRKSGLRGHSSKIKGAPHRCRDHLRSLLISEPLWPPLQEAPAGQGLPRITRDPHSHNANRTTNLALRRALPPLASEEERPIYPV